VTDQRAPLLSASTMLEELRQRVSDSADTLLAGGDESGATDLYEVERSLRQAARRLNRYLSARA
jgi:hypothetical protein